MKKIIFMGTPEFSVPILEALIASQYQVIAVVTQPDRLVGRKRMLTPPPVKIAALKHNIPIFQPEKISGSKEMEQLIKMDADLIVTAAYGQFLPSKLLNAPKYRAVNVHASLLPKYRGGAPVHYAIMNGEEETGVSIMYMERKMDAGDVLAQKSIPITADDDVQSMFNKLSTLGRDLLIDTLPKLFEGQLQPIPQDESLVTFSPNISREEERIDWNKPAQQISNKIRGMRPWPVAHAVLNGERCKIWQAQVLEDQTTSETPGKIISWDKESISVACGYDSVLKVLEIQPAGKKRMSVANFVNGNDMEVLSKIGFD